MTLHQKKSFASGLTCNDISVTIFVFIFGFLCNFTTCRQTSRNQLKYDKAKLN